MKVLFHVGPHKTGTTSIQHFLRLNGSKLAEQGIFVPPIRTIDNSSNHWYLVYVACSADDRYLAYHNTVRGSHTAEQCRTFNTKYTQALRKALTHCKEQEQTQGREFTFVISTEEVAYLNRDENNVLYRIFLDYCDSLEVLYYYRSPIERLRSDAQQGSKGGHVLREAIYKNLPCQDTARVKKFFPDAELRDRVTIRVQPYLRGINGHDAWDARLDLCKVAGIDIEGLQIPEKDPGANSNISLQMFSILQYINSAMPTLRPDKQFNPLKRHFHDAVEHYRWTPEDTPFRFSRTDINNLLQNRNLMEAFLSLDDTEPCLHIHPNCRQVFDSMDHVEVEEGVEGSIFNHVPSMSHKYYANTICHFWSFLHRATQPAGALNTSQASAGSPAML